MDDQNKNLLLAIALSALVMIVWMTMFPPQVAEDISSAVPTAETTDAAGATIAPAEPAAETVTDAPASVSVTDAPRVAIETPRLIGSVSLVGGRIDDLSLKDYRVELDSDEIVTLLIPEDQDQAYYSAYGWAPGGDLQLSDVPNANTVWNIENGDVLTPTTPISLIWNSSRGLTFRRQIEIDENFMFTVTQSVENTGESSARIAPYGFLVRHGEPTDQKGFFIIHEGAIRMVDGELTENDYGDLADLPIVQREAAQAQLTDVTGNGWIGFTDHYWMTTLIPTAGQAFTAKEIYRGNSDLYITEARLPTMTIAPGTTEAVTTQLFAGAKEWEAIREYELEGGVAGFLNSIDWGWFFFLTKPIFWLLHTLNQMIGNMGWSIIALTIVIKAAVLPLAYKSYASMAKMKELQPEMEALKERCGDDRQKMQQEMMKLYKDKKVNPAAGCLPILLQIPIFFSLYKVIFVTIELRHAQWVGWIRDLSQPDPSSLFNLFGILPWAPPEAGSVIALVFIGIMPIVLGVSMWLQQKLNPAPTDPTQKMIFAWMPWVFMFMLGSFASGLVLYWIANNTITFLQQYAIMRSHGYHPDVFGNIKSGLKRSRSDKGAGDK